MILALKECLETIPEAGTLTYFDVLTLSALHYFEREKVDGIVLEVGLGGRFDSTNICRPDVSVITGISLEHTELLGDTLAAIAGEKAGIIRPGVSVVSGVVEDEPRTVIRRIASERKSPLYEIDTDYQTERTPGSGPCRFLFSKAPSGALSITGFRPGMPGVHQERNAAVAAAAVELLVHTVHQDRQAGWRVTPENIRDGIASAVLPGRIEQLSDRPILIVDGAHNPASAEALVEVLRTLPGATGRRHLLFGAMSDKDVVGMLSVLLPFFDRVVFTRISGNPRAFSAEELAGLATVPDCGMRNETTIDFTVLDDPAKAFRRLQKEAAPDDLICVAGSLYLAAEIRSLVPVPGDQRSTVNT